MLIAGPLSSLATGLYLSVSSRYSGAASVESPPSSPSMRRALNRIKTPPPPLTLYRAGLGRDAGV